MKGRRKYRDLCARSAGVSSKRWQQKSDHEHKQRRENIGFYVVDLAVMKPTVEAAS